MGLDCLKPNFHLLRHVTTRHACDVTCHACRARRDERVSLVMRVVPCFFQHGGRRRSSILACTSL